MFDIGQKVACVNDSFVRGINDYFNALPVKGRVYTVRDIVPGQDWKLNATCAVLLEELANKPNTAGIEPGFHVTRFRELTPDEVKEIAEAMAWAEQAGIL